MASDESSPRDPSPADGFFADFLMAAGAGMTVLCGLCTGSALAVFLPGVLMGETSGFSQTFSALAPMIGAPPVAVGVGLYLLGRGLKTKGRSGRQDAPDAAQASPRYFGPILEVAGLLVTIVCGVGLASGVLGSLVRLLGGPGQLKEAGTALFSTAYFWGLPMALGFLAFRLGKHMSKDEDE